MKESIITRSTIAFFMSIVMPVIAVAVYWGVSSTKISNLETAVTTLQNNYNESSSEQVLQNLEIKIKLAEIQKDISYIKQITEKLE